MQLTEKLKVLAPQLEALYPDTLDGRISPAFRSGNDETMEYTIAYPIRDWQLNPFGILHGGMCATAFDSAMGMVSAAIADGKGLVTTDMFISYISRMGADDSFAVKVKVVRAGGKFIRLQAEGRSEKDGTLVATASASYLLSDEKQV